MIVTLTGSNARAVQVELGALTSAFTERYGGSIERFDATEITNTDGIVDAVRSISLLDPRKMVIVKQFAQNKQLLEKIDTIIAATADSTDLILVDLKADRRTAVIKNLKNTTDYREFNELTRNDLTAWVVVEAATAGGSISRADAQYLTDRIGGNQLNAASEIAKLVAYAPIITRQSIDLLTTPTPQSKVFDMLDALFRRELGRAWSLYEDQRAQGEDPHKLMAMIAWQLQQIATAVFAPSKDVGTLTAAGLSPYAAQKSLATARSLTPTLMRRMISSLAELDRQVKTSADIDSALAVYFVEIAYAQQ